MINYTIKDIQIGVGDQEFNKAFDLYNKGAVKNIEKTFRDFTAQVLGTHKYNVIINPSSYNKGDCDCYLGQKNQLCKHMLALAIALVYKYRPDDIEKINHPIEQAVCSGQVRDITKEELTIIKSEIKQALGYIKSYHGDSYKWFKYQQDLSVGSRLILFALSKLPVCKDSALLCIDTLKKLDKKILNGVDDSDGTIGDLMMQIIEVLNMFASSDSNLKYFIKNNLPKGEFFDWDIWFDVSENEEMKS